VFEPYRDAASDVDRILEGAKASDLPVQTPTGFTLVVSLNIGKALGLTISESFLLGAGEVFE
jgi:putative ABC transport system substrate-binding protein